MKTLNLENLGVQELDAKEMKEIDGGFWGVVLPIVASYILLEAALNPKAHIQAFKDGWNGVEHN